jgi:DNA polymerase-4
LRHKERDSLSIAHVDCDAFFAAVEKRDDPSLADKPVVIGGGKRGVVSTACYVARTYGVRSAMPMFQALKLCPHATVIKPNGEKYSKAGRDVRQLMRELTPLVEPVSIDEAFLDLTGTERLHHGSPALTLARFARKVEKEIGISISVGLSYNKFLAKIASDLQKPRGFSIIGREEAADFLADKPVGIIPGIGTSAQSRLAKVGVTQIAHLRDVPLRTLFEALGRDSLGWPGARIAGRSRRNAKRRASRRKRPSRRICAPSRIWSRSYGGSRKRFPAASRLPALPGRA